ncbi:MAG: VCBS repeat-containing protein [Phycisphaera sp.]|nr:MAG: VCBS repeat-containing protein [Phycisphaera sp.]
MTLSFLTAAALCLSAQPLEDMSASYIPLAATNGRTMDAEFADLDGDGDLDLVLAAEFGQNVVCFWEDNRFELQPDAITQGKRHDSEDIAIADFTGDGLLDIVIVAEDDQTNEFYINSGDGTFADASDRIPVSGTSNAVLALDIDADGDHDLLIGNKGTNVLLLNDGAGNFTDASDERLPTQADTTQDIEAGDIDGDGDPDLIIANEQANRILINDGKGIFADETQGRLEIKALEETREADLGDVDNDGDLDLVLANVAWSGADPTDRLLLNDGSGIFTRSDGFTADSVFSVDADFADIDSDGDLDIITANLGQGAAIPIRIYLNDGSGGFTNATTDIVNPMSLVHGIDIECVDINNDGSIEMYLTNHVSSDVFMVLKKD